MIGKIQGSSRFNKGAHNKNLKIYECESCIDDKEMGLYFKSKAYDCPSCGIVPGECERKLYDERHGLAGRSGVRFYCNVCRSQLGEFEAGYS